MQDTVLIYRVSHSGTDTTDASKFAPCYTYEMVNDSTCRTSYMFTEMKRNGASVKLMHWIYNRRVHADARLLTFNSRTVNFKARGGDTLSFYRELSWMNPMTSEQLLNNYSSLDTLDFSVYLVRVADGEPLALLDSIGILPTTPAGSPHVYGMRPLFSMVRYAIPPGLTPGDDSVFVGITVRARGNGKYHFIRRDGVTIAFSDKLNTPYYRDLLTLYGSVMSKRTIQDLERSSRLDGALSIRTEARSPRALTIEFTPPSDGGSTAIAVYDAGGNLVFYPYFGYGSGKSSTTCHLPHSGVYFVLLLHQGTVLQTKKIIID